MTAREFIDAHRDHAPPGPMALVAHMVDEQRRPPHGGLDVRCSSCMAEARVSFVDADRAPVDWLPREALVVPTPPSKMLLATNAYRPRMALSEVHSVARADFGPSVRYALSRRLADVGSSMLFVMLNPSTADAQTDDPTIRRCRAFARREGAARLDVVNLFVRRATKPTELRDYVVEPCRSLVGRDPTALAELSNDDVIAAHAWTADVIVLAWGAVPMWARPRAARVALLVLEMFHDRCWVLGWTKGGDPRHPLYVRGDAPLVRWRK